MAKFNIGEFVRIKDDPIDTPCVVVGYAGIGSSSGEQLYCIRRYGGGVIDIPISESNLERC